MNSGLKERIQKRQASLKTTCETLLDKQPLIALEIGCGHGHFLVSYAQAFPTTFCVGIDINQERITSAQKKNTKANLGNLYFLKAEANEFLEALPPLVQLSDIFILFPDPWPKNRHHKNRLIQTDFLTFLTTKASPQARLYFKTDHLDYFNWTQKILSHHHDWKTDPSATWPLPTQTHFEKMFEQHHALIATHSPSS